MSIEEELFMLDVQEQMREEEKQEIELKEKQRTIEALNEENLSIKVIAKVTECPIKYIKKVLAKEELSMLDLKTDLTLIDILNMEGLAVSRAEELFMLNVQGQMTEEEKQEIKLKEKQRTIKALNEENLSIEVIAKVTECPIEYVKQVLVS